MTCPLRVDADWNSIPRFPCSQTALLVLTPLLLILIAVGSVYMLSAVGSETLPNTLTLSAGGGRRS